MSSRESIAPADRKLLWGAGLVALLMVGATLGLAPAQDPNDSPVPSTYSSSSGGARAAYLLLLDLGYSVRRWEEPPSGLENLDEDAILILADPTQPPSKGEQSFLRRFVERGGQILFSGAGLHEFFPEVKLSNPTAGAKWTEYSPALPTPYARGADKIILQPEAYWPTKGDFGEVAFRQLPLYGEESMPVVVAWSLGKGQVFWWAGSTPLTNAGIRQAGNLNLFLNTVSGPAAHDSRTIYWDEYFHGMRGSLWTYLQNTPVIWGAVQLLLLSLAVLFTFSRRSGPLASPAVVSRLSPLEFVNTMAGLYQKAHATPIAVAVAYRHLRLELAHRLGLPPATPDAALAQAAAERLGSGADGLGDALQKAAAAAESKKLPVRQALGLVQTLQRYTVRLTGSNPSPSSQEKL